MIPIDQDSRPIDVVEQHHYGDGDNVHTKYIYQSILPESIQRLSREVMQNLIHRHPEAAESVLATIEKLDNLGSDSTLLLRILRLKLNCLSADTVEMPEVIQSLPRMSDLFILDVAYSTLVDGYALKQSNNQINRLHRDVIKKHDSWLTIFPYYAEAYIRTVVDNSEVQTIFNSDETLLEPVLCGLCRAALRQEQFYMASDIAARLTQDYPSHNSAVLLVAARFGKTFKSLSDSHYWSINSATKKEIDWLCDEAASLVEKTNGDKRLLLYTTDLLTFTGFGNEKLVSASSKYLDKISKISNSVSDQIKLILEIPVSGQDEYLAELSKCINDPGYLESITKKTLETGEITPLHYTLISSSNYQSDEFTEACRSITIKADSAYEQDLIALELVFRVKPDGIDEIKSVEDKLESFIANYSANDHIMALPRVVNLCRKINQTNSILSQSVIELLKPLVPTYDIWASELVDVFLNALLLSNQLLTFNTYYESLDLETVTLPILIFRVDYFRRLNDRKNLMSISKVLTSKYPNEIGPWFIDLQNYSVPFEDVDEKRNILDKIPDIAFSGRSPYTFSILSEMMGVGDVLRAHRIQLQFFSKDPIKTCIPLTNAHFSQIKTYSKPTHIESVIDDGPCVLGVAYKKGSQHYLKMIVSNEVGENDHFIRRDSILGQRLISAPINDTFQYKFTDVTVLERLPPYVAALRICVKLRDNSSTDDDSFFMLEMPTDKDEMIAFMERMLQSNQQEVIELAKSDAIPFYMKTYREFRNECVKASLSVFCRKEYFKNFLFNFGDDNPTGIILDAFSICYLAVTNIFEYQNVACEYFISIETKGILEGWLSDVESESYMSLGLSDLGKLQVVTSEHIKRDQDIPRALRYILERVKVADPMLCDLPPVLSALDDVIDISVLSTIKLSIANNIHWLCLDPYFASYADFFGYKIVNSYDFFRDGIRNVPFNKRRLSITWHAHYRLPYLLTQHDLFEIARFGKKYDFNTLTKIIDDNPEAFTNLVEAYRFYLSLSFQMILNVAGWELVNEYNHDRPGFDAHIKRVIYSALRSIMRMNPEIFAETKFIGFALDLCAAVKRTRNEALLKTISMYLTEYMLGNFLDQAFILKMMKDVHSKIAPNQTAVSFLFADE